MVLRYKDKKFPSITSCRHRCDRRLLCVAGRAGVNARPVPIDL